MNTQWVQTAMVGMLLGCSGNSPGVGDGKVGNDSKIGGDGRIGRDGGIIDAAPNPRLTTVAFDPAVDKTVETPSGARVQFAAGTLVRASGDPPVGQVTARLDHVVHKGSGPEHMPGGFTATDSTGATVDLISFGVIDVDIEDEAGNAIDLAGGKMATITIPALAPGPPTIPLWYLPDGTSVWVEEGSATLQGDSYVGEVSHFTPWNVDVPLPPTCPRGCVESFLQGDSGDRYTLRLVKDACDVWGDTGGLTGVVFNSNGQFKIENLIAGATYRVQRVGHPDRGIVTVPAADATECAAVEWHADYVFTLELKNSGSCPANRAINIGWTVSNEPPGGKYPNYGGSTSTGVHCSEFNEAKPFVLGALYGDAKVTLQLQDIDTGSLVGPVLHERKFTANEPTLRYDLGSFNVP